MSFPSKGVLTHVFDNLSCQVLCRQFCRKDEYICIVVSLLIFAVKSSLQEMLLLREFICYDRHPYPRPADKNPFSIFPAETASETFSPKSDSLLMWTFRTIINALQMKFLQEGQYLFFSSIPAWSQPIAIVILVFCFEVP